MTNNTLYYDEGQLKYKGDLEDNVPHGYGIAYWDHGSKWYEGEFVNGEPKGVGTFYFPNGQVRYTGQTEDLQQVGFGIEYFKSGQIKFIGVSKKTPHFFYNARCYVEGHLFYGNGALRYSGTFTGMKHYAFKDGIEYLPDHSFRIYGTPQS